MRSRIPALVSLVAVAGVLCVLPFILSDYNVSRITLPARPLARERMT